MNKLRNKGVGDLESAAVPNPRRSRFVGFERVGT